MDPKILGLDTFCYWSEKGRGFYGGDMAFWERGCGFDTTFCVKNALAFWHNSGQGNKPNKSWLKKPKQV